MIRIAFLFALLSVLSATAVSNATAWKPNTTDYVQQTAASAIQQDATNFLLLNEADYDKHLADKPLVNPTTDDRMQCVRRVQAYRCN